MASEQHKKWEAELAAFHWKYVPTAKRFLLYASKRIVRDKGRDAVGVLVDAKEEGGKDALTPDLISLTQEIPEDTWNFLRRAAGVLTIDEIAADLDLPPFERIEEINEEYIWDSAIAVSDDTDSEEFMDAQHEAQDELWRQWKNAVASSATRALYVTNLDLYEDPAKAGYYDLVSISSGPPSEEKKHPWRSTGRNIAMYLDLDDKLVEYGQKEFLRRQGASTWREFSFNMIDDIFSTVDKTDARRVYDRAF